LLVVGVQLIRTRKSKAQTNLVAIRAVGSQLRLGDDLLLDGVVGSGHSERFKQQNVV